MADNVEKFVTNDPNVVVTKVDANQVDSLLKEGEGNSLVLDSIKTTQDIPETEEATSIHTENAERQLAIDAALLKMQASAAFGEDTEDLDFAELSKQCEDEDSEELLAGMGKEFEGIAGTGDISALDTARAKLDTFGLDSVGVLSALVPMLIPLTLANFDLDKLMSGASPDLKSLFGDTFNNLLNNFLDDWYWLDKDLGIYNYEVLAAISPWALTFLEVNPKYKEPARLARALYEYRTEFEK